MNKIITSEVIESHTNNVLALREQNARWEKIIIHKKEFLEHQRDPFSFTDINPEVAASWIRSRENGIDPYKSNFGQQLNSAEINKSRSVHRLLIKDSEPLFKTFSNLTRHSRYNLNLDDRNGVSLLQDGIDSFPMYHSQLTGKMCNENMIGTNAHFLSVSLKRPVQLLGPEHFCIAFQSILATAAPICNELGEVIAILSLCSRLNREDNVQKIMEHSLSYATTIASAIEAKHQLRNSYDQITIADKYNQTANDIFSATLELIEEGIVTIDLTGKIIHVNKAGSRILRLEPADGQYRNIKEFLSEQSNLIHVFNQGGNSNVREAICVGNDIQHYIINIQTVINQNTKKICGAVLRFNNPEKTKLVRGDSVGAQTQFCFKDIIGESEEMKSVTARGLLFANTSENVLLVGESGTGKELFAQAIHNVNRPQEPFIAINCAAIPRSLIESELFGYEGGSFTGAERSGRPGKIELANGGTLFLDEIGDMPYELQAVLLRILQDKQIMRIGGRTYKKIDFRVIAATNKDLHKMVAENLFREDLYYRLAVLSLKIPSLGQREDDIEILTKHFIRNHCTKIGKEVLQITPAAIRKIREYHWPGNVRELENAVIYAVSIVQGDVIESKHLPESILLHNEFAEIAEENGPKKRSKEAPSRKEIEKSLIETTLIKAKYDIPRTATLLGLGRATVYRKLKEYNIEY